jgi:hypothetical protein
MHMVRFPAFPGAQLNPGMRDIGDCRWVKPTHRAAITPTQGINLDVGATEHTLSKHVSRYISYTSRAWL